MQSILSPAIFLILLLVSSLSSPPRSLWSTQSEDNGTKENHDNGVVDVPNSFQFSAASPSEYFWIRVKGDDENPAKCLGQYGFTICGDLSFWMIISHTSPIPGSPSVSEYQLRLISVYGDEFIHADTPEHSSQDALCLTQKRYFSFHSAPYLAPCVNKINSASSSQVSKEEKINPSSLWTLSPSGQFQYSYRGSKRCLVKSSKNEASTEKCQSTSTRFEVVSHVHTEHSLNHVGGETDEALASRTEHGTLFSSDITKKFCSILPDGGPCNESSVDRHVLLGGGVFSKQLLGFELKVYSVAWYIDQEGAAHDKTLQQIMSHSDSKSLHKMQSYYDALIAPNRSYDRSLVVKFLMNINSETAMGNLIEDSYLSSKNMDILSQTYKGLKTSLFEKSMEVVFTWRGCQVQNTDPIPPSKSQGSCHASDDILSIHIIKDNDEELYSERNINVVESLQLVHPGLARDLFLQFVHPDDPVSQSAKSGFATNFHTLMSGIS